MPQGAGGNCNVVKEIIYPLGAEIDVRAIKLGDQTLSVLEIWGAEYQENDCLLIKPEARGLLESICARERCLMQVGMTHPLAWQRVRVGSCGSEALVGRVTPIVGRMSDPACGCCTSAVLPQHNGK